MGTWRLGQPEALSGVRNVLFYADTTAYAEELRDEGDLVCRLDLDTELAYPS